MTTQAAPITNAPTLAEFLPGGPLAPEADNRIELVGLDKAELAAVLAPLGLPAFRAKQIYRWIYVSGATSFAQMTDLGKELRAKLETHFRIGRPRISAHQVSVDGTQ